MEFATYSEIDKHYVSLVASTPALFKIKLWGVKTRWCDSFGLIWTQFENAGQSQTIRLWSTWQERHFKLNEVVHHWCKHYPSQSQEAVYVFVYVGDWRRSLQLLANKTRVKRQNVGLWQTWSGRTCFEARILHGTVSSECGNHCNTFSLLQIASLEMHVYRNYLVCVVWPSVCRFAPRTRTSMKITSRRSIT